MSKHASQAEIICGQHVYTKSCEAMTELADEFIDVIVTSPPYNRGKSYQGDDDRSYDDSQPAEKYQSFLTQVFTECRRVLKNDGVFFLNIGDSATDAGKSMDVLACAQRAGFHLLQPVIWVKSLLGRGHYTPSGGRRRLNNIWEYVFILVKNRKKYRLDSKAIGIPYADKSNIGRYSDEDRRDPGNVWLIPYQKTSGQTIKKGHDAPFPRELAMRCMRMVPGCERVLDPFLGLGTSLAASRQLGLEGYGYELYPSRALIRETISQELEEAPELCLLPHLEQSVLLLAKAVASLPELPKTLRAKQKTRKGRGQLSILCDVLRQLQGSESLIDKLEALTCPPAQASEDEPSRDQREQSLFQA